VSDNPRIGFTGAKLLAKALTSPNFTFVEMANVGAGPGTAHIIADGIRNVDLQWNFIDISGNNMSRSGLNHIFWAARQNRSLRVLLVGDNSAGSHFGTAEDRNLNHGIAVQRAIMANTMIRGFLVSAKHEPRLDRAIVSLKCDGFRRERDSPRYSDL
jgi:hypothetical protein